MKKERMSFLVALSITTGVFCGIWYVIAGMTGLIAWAGFAGCTTYFATGQHNKEGIMNTILPNLAGVACGMTSIFFGTMFPGLDNVGLWAGLISFVICMLSHFKCLKFTPGIFVGCFSTFASGGNWKLVVPSIFLGAFLGWICDASGAWLYKTVSGGKEEK